MKTMTMLSDYENNSAPNDVLRDAWVEIDLGALRSNFFSIKNSLKPGVKILAVVKADAYGHGAKMCAKTLDVTGADYFGVATAKEGIELRDEGIEKPILILSQPPKSAIEKIVEFDLMPSIYDAQFAIQYGEAADRVGKKAPFHLAVNTGMNRIGVLWSEVVEFLSAISFHRALELEGIFTHFATADEIDTLEFERQFTRFEKAIECVRLAKIDPGIVHCANSASVLKFPNAHFDMVRPGIILYGLKPSPETIPEIELKPVMSVKAKITDVRSVPVGEGVSYGLRYRSRGYAKVCTIPIGYADGLHRVLSGNFNVLLNGKRYQQIGSICMDQCMFEVEQRHLSSKDNFDPQVGQVVTLVGKDGEEQLTLDEMANIAQTINYELACDFGSMRLDRVYV